MWAKNVTGVLQVHAKSGTQLVPGEWVNLPYQIALALWKIRVCELRECEPGEEPEERAEYLWKTKGGNLHLFWMSPFSLGDGYATAAEQTALELARQGVKISIAPCWFVSRYGLDPETLKRLDKPHPGPIRVGLCMATPGEFKKLPTPYKIGLTMYEADDPLRNMPEWRHDCSVVDMLLTPSQYCKEVFSNFVEAPIKVTPLAINPLYYAPEGYLKKRKKRFIFGMHGTLTARKSPIETIDAFCRAFPRHEYPDVQLQLKTRLGVCGSSQDNLPTITDPRVRIIDKDWMPKQVRRWFTRTLDVYLYPSKGGGYGMTPREAMASGCPTILSNNTGMIEVCDDRYNWPIPVHHLETSPLGGNWRIPDWNVLIETMRWMHDNREASYEKAALASKWFIENYGAAQAAARIKHILEEIDPNLPSHVPIKVSETIESGAEEQHEFLLNRIERLVSPPARVIDLGVGEGVLYNALHKRGYEMVGIVTPGRLATAARKLQAAGITPTLYEAPLSQATQLGLTADLVVSLNVIQDLRIQETSRVFSEMFGLAPKRIFAVPSVHYPRVFSEEAQMHRLAYYEDLLRKYEYEVRYYGPKRRYVYGVIHKLDTGLRGVVVRRPGGRIVDGVWRAATDATGSRGEI